MTACIVEKLPNGGFRVSRDFANQSAATLAMNRLLEINEAAFEPVNHPDVPLPPAAAVQIAASEDQD